MHLFTQPSLFKRLMFSILFLGFVLWGIVVFFMIHDLKKIPERFARIHLQSIAQQQMAVFKAIPNDDATITRYATENDALQKQLHKQLSIFVSQYHMQLWRGEKLIVSTLELSATKPHPDELERITHFQTNHNTWLTWSLYEPGSDVTLRVAQGNSVGFSLSYRMLGYYLMPFVISVPFLVFPVWWAISRGLRPLNRIAADIATRTDTDLEKINDTPYKELQPIVNGLNRLMKRVGERIQREQEFLHDAAHELKTPLAVIKLNSEILASTKDVSTQQLALAGLQKGVARATHTTHQLLASARADNRQGRSEIFTSVNLTQLLQDRLAQWTTLALQKNIEIELNAPPVCELKVYIEAISLLIDNLVDNAIKYSGSGSLIQVFLIDSATSLTLQVIDQGCGIPEEYREKVFERFFRLHQSNSHGTGLGLSIVKRAAQQHSASIRLAHNTQAGRGLVVTIEFQRNN